MLISNCETICISSFVINILLTEIIIITMFNWRTRLPVVSITNNQTDMWVHSRQAAIPIGHVLYVSQMI